MSVPSDAGHPESDLEDEQGELRRVHHPRRALPTDVVRPTRAEVHLDALRYNLGQLRKVAGTTPIWAVLKADAYGHGSKAVARTLERAHVDGICVALVEEGIELRQAGIRLPILVMGGYYGNAFREFLEHRLTPVLSDEGQVQSLARALNYSEETSFSCHIKVDTGMARLGARPRQWPSLIARLSQESRLSVQGLMTHLANADVEREGVFEEPLRLFHDAAQRFTQAGLRPGSLHMANSAALLRDPRTHFDLVRPGVALFGVDPVHGLNQRGDTEKQIRLKSTMSVLSRIVSLRQIENGDSVGYGGTYQASGTRLIATVPMGYADGLSRAQSNRGFALVRGRRAAIVGNVSMDMTMLDVTEHAGVSMGDEVVFLGDQKGPLGSETITPFEVAKSSGTIAWEVLTNISRRVPRFYREA